MHRITPPAAGLLATLLLAAVPGIAAAKVGLNLSGSSSSETYTYPAGEAVVDWTRITLQPWWSQGPWKVDAEIPFLMRDAQSEGSTLGLLHYNDTWSLVSVTGSYDESDRGIGDIYTSATYSWKPENWLRPYLTGELKLPTGDEDAVLIHFNDALASSARSQSSISFGNGSTDFRFGPGVEVRNKLAWARTEASYIWSNDADDIPTEDRAAAYAGVGLTPKEWLEFTVGYNYEGEVIDGADALQQTTYAIIVRPEGHRIAISLATYGNEDSSNLSENWALGISAGF